MMTYWGDITDKLKSVKVYGVSEVAVSNFNEFYPSIKASVLEYGIPDESSFCDTIERTGRIVFAVIGGVYEIKGQDLFLDSIEELDEEVGEKCEFWIIGKLADTDYCKKIVARSQSNKRIKLLGALDHDELINIYNNIDIIVSSSREDMLPIVVVEGMMMGKRCIIPDKIGISNYISDGKEAITYKTCDVSDLSRKMSDLINDYDHYATMCRRAYELYTNVFSMEAFYDRLRNALY